MDLRVIAAAAAGAGLMTVVLLFVSRRSRKRKADTDLAALARRYRNWEIGGVVLTVVAMLLSWLALLGLAHRYPMADVQVEYRLTANPLYWLFVAFFIGNLIAVGVTHWLYPRLLRERFAEFRAYQTRKFGFDAVHWMLPFSILFGSLSAFTVAVLLDWYVLIGEDAIVINEITSFSARRYSYAQLLQIRSAARTEKRAGGVDDRWSLVLQFDDGKRWSSERDPSCANEQRWREIAAYVSARSSLPIVEVAVLVRSEL